MAQKSVEQTLTGMRNWLIGLTILSLATCGVIIYEMIKGGGDAPDPTERVYNNMMLYSSDLDVILSQESGGDPNAIKQVYYTWYERNGIWALKAYGVDEKGNRLSREVDLTISDPSDYTVLKDLTREKMINTRGQLKVLLGSGELGRDVPIEKDLYSNIRFTSALRETEPGVNTMFYETRAASTTNTGRINPAPPFSVMCTTCDER